MKRYGQLIGQICDRDNVVLAHERARRGKGHYREVKRINLDPERYAAELADLLRSGNFRTGQYTTFRTVERGKERIIHRLPYWPDRVVHHAILQVLAPIWDNIFIRDTYSSIPGRGVHDGLYRMRHWLESDPAGTAYCLKLDVRKYYPSIDHGICKAIVRRSIKCAPTLALIDEIIDSTPDPGLPIGNYLSQYLANLYLAYFDHWVKEELHCRYYSRYCDDLVLLHADKTVLHDWRRRIAEYLHRELALTLKANWQAFPVAERGVDYLGYRAFGTHTLVRKRMARGYRRAVLRNDSRSLAAYRGWIVHADTFNLQRHTAALAAGA